MKSKADKAARFLPGLGESSKKQPTAAHFGHVLGTFLDNKVRAKPKGF
jgi:hypothetical protein